MDNSDSRRCWHGCACCCQSYSFHIYRTIYICLCAFTLIALAWCRGPPCADSGGRAGARDAYSLYGARHSCHFAAGRGAPTCTPAPAPASAPAPAPVGNDDLLDAETQAQLIALGIASPVTREVAGARYHHELARQLADFLLQPAAAPAPTPTPSELHAAGAAAGGGAGDVAPSLLRKYGGMMTLPDVYCLFNRWGPAAHMPEPHPSASAATGSMCLGNGSNGLACL